MNKWLVLGMVDTQSAFSESHGSDHFHVPVNATGWITSCSPPWWKGLVFLLWLVELFPHLVSSSPELGAQRGQAASSSRRSGLPPFTRSAGNGDSSPSSTLGIARPRKHRSSAGHPPGLTITFDKKHLMSTATIIMAQPLERTVQCTLTAMFQGK